jgi:hypothetical protein
LTDEAITTTIERLVMRVLRASLAPLFPKSAVPFEEKKFVEVLGPILFPIEELVILKYIRPIKCF